MTLIYYIIYNQINEEMNRALKKRTVPKHYAQMFTYIYINSKLGNLLSLNLEKQWGPKWRSNQGI